jgi:hypothetical protein
MSILGTMIALSISPMPVPEVMCKGWLCLMGSKHPEADKWRDGLCPECLDELAKQEIEDQRNAAGYANSQADPL